MKRQRSLLNLRFKTHLKIISIFILMFSLQSANAAPMYFDQNINGSNGESLKSPGSPKMAGNTGALQYDYNFKIPSGRSGMTPDVSVSYNSQTENNQNRTIIISFVCARLNCMAILIFFEQSGRGSD